VRAAIAAFSLSLVAGPALAQTADDGWDMTENPATETLAASLTYATGDNLMVVCRRGVLDVFLATRATSPTARMAEIRFDEGETGFESWYATPNPAVVVSGLPGPNARRLGASRRLTIVFRPAIDSAEAPQRHVLDLPANADGIGRVLDACSQPRTDPRDALPRWNVSEIEAPDGGWARMPRPEFPERALRAGIQTGFATFSCIVGPAGEARDCQVEKESDPRAGFGAAALTALRSARVKITGPNAATEGRLFSAVMRFRIR
jgi:TonB family protein